MKNKIINKSYVFGTMLNEIYFPNIMIMYKNCDYDFVLIDCEHGTLSYEQVGILVTAARYAGISVIVRIPEIKRECVLKYLDLGADGLLAPMVENAEQVNKFVEYAKYPPVGRRGVSIHRAHSMYNIGNVNEYIENANKRIMLFVQIELKKSIDNIESIAAVENIDGLIVGPSDLSIDLGVFNQFEHESIINAIKKTVHTADTNNLVSGIITGNMKLIDTAVKFGMTVICRDSETRILSDGLMRNMNELVDIVK